MRIIKGATKQNRNLISNLALRLNYSLKDFILKILMIFNIFYIVFIIKYCVIMSSTEKMFLNNFRYKALLYIIYF